MPKATKKRPKQPDALTQVLKDFRASWNYTHTTYHELWHDCWKLYNNQRVEKSYDGITNTFVPMTFSTVETMVAALAGSRPRFDFVPTRPEQEVDTKVLNFLLDHFWDKDKWQSKVDKWIRSMLMYGTGVMFMYWDIDHPCVLNVPLRDFFVDPSASNLGDARFMGRRYLTTVEALKEYEYVDENGELKPVYKNLEKVKSQTGSVGEETDKEQKDLFFGSTLGKHAAENQVECIEYWTPEKVVVVANRAVIIRDDKNPHLAASEARGDESPKGLLPFVIQRNYVDESLFYGKGEIEPVLPSQELLNDLTNQNIDAITYALNPMWNLDPKYSDQKEQVESLPGAVYTMENGALSPITMPSIPNNAFNERLNLKNEIRETSASDQVVKGVSQEQGDVTATEIRAQVAQAGARFSIKISQIENEGYHDLAKLVLDMVQLYVTEPMMVQVIGEQRGVDWQIYDPDAFQGEFDVKVQLESTVEANKQEEADNAREMFLAMADDPLVNQKELRRIAFKKVFSLDEDEVETLLTPEPMEGLPGEAIEGEVMPELPMELETVPPEMGGMYG